MSKKCVLTEHIYLDTDQIENYLLHHLNEPEIAVVEESLLVCERCREICSPVETDVCEIRQVMRMAVDQPMQISVRAKKRPARTRVTSA
jgi:hypothetical protein